MKHWNSKLAVAALSLATMVGVAGAQQPPRGHGHGIDFMATALDLTDAQVAQIKQIQSDQHTNMQSSHQQLHSLHQQLQAVVASDNFDEAKAQSIIAQVQQLQSAQMLAHAKEMNAIYKVLNPQQKAKAVKLFSQMHGGFGHGGPGGPVGAPDAPPPPQD